MDIMLDDFGKRALDFVESMKALSDVKDICERIAQELEWFGYLFVTVADMPGPGMSMHDGLIYNNRPETYIEHYERKNYLQKDPVMLAVRDEYSPFAWTDVRQKLSSRSAQHIIDEGRDFGATDGLMIPIRTAAGRVSIFSPCGRDPNLSPRARSAMEIIGIYSHQALQRALLRERRTSATPIPLTAREREVLTWVATGKSDDEIGMILGIGRETVTTYVENAKRKLDATKRVYAVIQALRLGEINL